MFYIKKVFSQILMLLNKTDTIVELKYYNLVPNYKTKLYIKRSKINTLVVWQYN